MASSTHTATDPYSAAQHPEHGESHMEGGEAHATMKDYVTGFVLSVILTALPFWLVMARPIEDSAITGILVIGFAVAQIFVHMVYFLHMDAKSEGGWTIMALIFTATLLIIVISGSLWVMYHLNSNMMPMGEMRIERTMGDDSSHSHPVNELAPFESVEDGPGPADVEAPPPLVEDGGTPVAPDGSSSSDAGEGDAAPAGTSAPQPSSAGPSEGAQNGGASAPAAETGSGSESAPGTMTHGESGRPHIVIIPRAGNGS